MMAGKEIKKEREKKNRTNIRSYTFDLHELLAEFQSW